MEYVFLMLKSDLEASGEASRTQWNHVSEPLIRGDSILFL
jgi:hypothetical protein